MEENTTIKKVVIEDQLKEAYLDYSMSVIVGRALPDIRDGLKPVHRRILFTMHEMGLTNAKPFRKSAMIVGACFKYHPHGDAPIYESLVRMAQDFNLRYPLIHGHGNFACFTGDTKVKLVDGTSKTFKELCEIYKNKKFYVYSVDKNGETVIGEASNPRLTREKTKIIEITLDNGEKIRCTPDHRFLLKDLTYKEAQYLTSEDSLMPGHFKLSPIKGNTELKDYLMIKNNKTEKYNFIHELADKFNIKNNIYSISDGDVRHHIDFNKFNNNPNNIKRISWKDHTIIHNDHIKTLWQSEEFRKKQSDGIKNFYKNNPEHIKKLRERIAKISKDPKIIKKSAETRKKLWQIPENKKKLSEKIKASFERNPGRKIKQSESSRKMWADKSKREEIIRRIKEVTNTQELKEKRSIARKKYIQEHPNELEIVSKRLKEFYINNPEARETSSKRTKELWQTKEYRDKFFAKLSNREFNTNPTYFSKIAKKAWTSQEYQQLQSKRVKKLWNNNDFKTKLINSVKQSNKKRLENNPKMMLQLAQKAALSHKVNWKNPEYKNKIIKNKVLYYVNRLISSIGEENINAENYENNRKSNAYPKFENAIKYFKDINEMISLAKEYNHHIINIKFLDYTEDVYDIEVNEHHNFLLDSGVFVHNSVDMPTSFAHMRYTEAKLHKLSEEMLLDIDKDTVNFVPNFDGSLKEPVVLPSKLPNLLINGSTGIAVGMATNIPPHNVSEIIDSILLLLTNPNSEIDDLIKIVKGPDFPTGALICGKKGIVDYFKTGKGKLIVRAKTELEDNKIIIKQIPYQVNKSTLLESIANLVKECIVEGVRDIRDETDKTGIRVIIDLKKDADQKLVLNQLFKHSSLQTTFGVIMLSLVDNEPKILNLKEIIEKFILHRKQVVTRRTKFDLNKAEEKAHILEGLQIALANIDKVIELIKQSENAEIAKTNLSTNFNLTEKQSLAILEMRLQRLTNLETKKILEDLEKTKKLIEELKSILSSEIKIIEIIRNELTELKEKYSDKRRTEVVEEEAESIIHEDLIKEENIVVTLTYSGYIKQVPLTTYKQQGRGGKGIQGTSTKDEEDIVKNLLITSNLNYLMFFTNKGKVFWLKGYEIPEVSRQAKGKAIVNLLNLEENEKINTILSVKDYKENQYLVFATKKGVVKKTSLAEYSNVRKSGIIAINLRENDEVVKVILTENNSELILTSKLGKAIRFSEKDMNEVGRNSTGVRGIKLQEKDEVIGLEIVINSEGVDKNLGTLLTVTEKGFGKRTSLEEYAVIHRGGKGVRNIKVSEKNSFVVSTSIINDNDELIIITKKGQVIRLNVKDINIIGRNTSGVRLIRVNENDSVASVAKISNE